MKRILKYTLGSDFIRLPKDAKILSCDFQSGDILQIWALVDTTQPLVLRGFNTYATGCEVEVGPTDIFVGTAQSENGFVLHVFDKGESNV